MDGEKWDLTHAHVGSFRQANANGGPTVPCSIRSQDRLGDFIARPPRQEKLMMLILKGLCLGVSTC